jgi:hypothetical protein
MVNPKSYLKRFQVALDCYIGAEIESPNEATSVAIFLENNFAPQFPTQHCDSKLVIPNETKKSRGKK